MMDAIDVGLGLGLAALLGFGTYVAVEHKDKLTLVSEDETLAEKRAFAQGRADATLRPTLATLDNPYPRGTPEWAAWFRGYYEGSPPSRRG